jgi:hypothetical protein
MSLGLLICLGSFALCYLLGRYSLVKGLISTFAVGYVFGITKANLPETASYFIFDAAVLGLYAAQMFQPLTRAMSLRVERLKLWVELLILWPLIIFFFPLQDLMIRLVGLRTAIFFLPFLLIGARLLPEERYKLALGLAGLNLLALGFGGAEFLVGVPQFFPVNQATKIIYLSKDVAEHTAYRIPASFANAHAFAGAMVVTIPLIAGALLQEKKQQWHFHLLIMGLAASVVGVLLSAARLSFVVVAILIVVLTFSIKSRVSYAFGWIVIMAAIALFASGEVRMQRFTDLSNAELIAERVGWSVNMTFFELAARYPFGNGLGGGGSSIPYFLQDRLEGPVTMENEYARIMLEQGIFGLLLWIAFIVWLFTRGKGDPSDTWREGRRLAWCTCLIMFGTGLIGVGLFVAVPQTCLLLVNAGWVAARQKVPVIEQENRIASSPLKYARQLAT